jgi:hypothetical protein
MAQGKFLPSSKRETKKMIRYSIFLFSVLGMAATAIAHVTPAPATPSSHGTSIAYRTVAAAPAHNLILEKCAVEDCSDTPQ